MYNQLCKTCLESKFLFCTVNNWSSQLFLEITVLSLCIVSLLTQEFNLLLLVKLPSIFTILFIRSWMVTLFLWQMSEDRISGWESLVDTWIKMEQLRGQGRFQLFLQSGANTTSAFPTTEQRLHQQVTSLFLSLLCTHISLTWWPEAVNRLCLSASQNITGIAYLNAYDTFFYLSWLGYYYRVRVFSSVWIS